MIRDLAYSPPNMLKTSRKAAYAAVLPTFASRALVSVPATLLALLSLLLLTTTGVG